MMKAPSTNFQMMPVLSVGASAARSGVSTTSGTYLTYRYSYDYLGRRVRKETINAVFQLIEDTKFIWVGWQVIAELDGFNLSGAGAGNVKRSYAWGLDAMGTLGGAGGTGALLMHKDGASRYLPVYDGRQNVRGYLDESGNIVAAFEYSAFGETVASGGSYTTAPIRYASLYQDSETGMYYHHHRYYHPGFGRFINRDPIGVAGGLNLYAYVGNGATNRWDRLGLCPPGQTEVMGECFSDDELINVAASRIKPPPGAGWAQAYYDLTRGSWDSYTDDLIAGWLEQMQELAETFPEAVVPAPNKSDDKRTDCEKYVDGLMAKTPADVGYFSRWSEFSSTGSNLLDWAESLRNIEAPYGTSGFRPELTMLGQGSQVVRHSAGTAGAYLLTQGFGTWGTLRDVGVDIPVIGGFPLSGQHIYAGQMFNDLIQVPIHLRNYTTSGDPAELSKALEGIPEALGNQAGWNAGKTLADYMRGDKSQLQTRAELIKIFCK